MSSLPSPLTSSRRTHGFTPSRGSVETSDIDWLYESTFEMFHALPALSGAPSAYENDWRRHNAVATPGGPSHSAIDFSRLRPVVPLVSKASATARSGSMFALFG